MEVNKTGLILCIESTEQVCSVALLAETGLIGELSSTEQQSQASETTILIGQLLQQHGKSFEDIVAVAVSEGPGSYTGLRIGISVAKGLCYALNIPLIGINSLEALCLSLLTEEKNAVSCLSTIDARNSRVYYCFLHRQAPDVQQVGVMDVNSLVEHIQQNQEQVVHVCGSGLKYFEGRNNFVLNQEFTFNAKFFQALVFDKFKASAFESIHTFQPKYYNEPNITTSKKVLI